MKAQSSAKPRSLESSRDALMPIHAITADLSTFSDRPLLAQSGRSYAAVPRSIRIHITLEPGSERAPAAEARAQQDEIFVFVPTLTLFRLLSSDSLAGAKPTLSEQYLRPIDLLSTMIIIYWQGSPLSHTRIRKGMSFVRTDADQFAAINLVSTPAVRTESPDVNTAVNDFVELRHTHVLLAVPDRNWSMLRSTCAASAG
jgi:hypothetical protein